MTIPVFYTALLFSVIAYFNLISPGYGLHHTLAESFLRGQLHFIGYASGDTAFYQGRYYCPLGPFPALLAMPFVWAGYPIHQGVENIFGSVGVFYFCHRLARLFGYDSIDASWFAIALCFGTSFIGVASVPWPNYYPHVLATLFLLAAIVEYETRQRWFLVGLLVGLAMANRPPTALNVLAFVFLSRSALKLYPGFGSVALLLALYNYARFDNPLEAGYGLQITGSGAFYSTVDIPGNRSGQLFSLMHFWTNFKVFVFGLPEVRAVGSSVFLVSPFLIYLVKIRWDRTSVILGATVCVTLAFLLCFRSTGFIQMGYRFSLDFMPLVFWMMMRSKIEVTPWFRAIVAASGAVNLVLVLYFLATGIERVAVTGIF